MAQHSTAEPSSRPTDPHLRSELSALHVRLGQPVAPGSKRRLRHQSLLVIERTRLLFVVNLTLLGEIRRQISSTL